MSLMTESRSVSQRDLSEFQTVLSVDAIATSVADTFQKRSNPSAKTRSAASDATGKTASAAQPSSQRARAVSTAKTERIPLVIKTLQCRRVKAEKLSNIRVS